MVDFNRGRRFERVPWTEVDVAQGDRLATDSCWLDAAKIAHRTVTANPGEYRPKSIHPDLIQESAMAGVRAIESWGRKAIARTRPPLNSPPAYLRKVVTNELRRRGRDFRIAAGFASETEIQEGKGFGSVPISTGGGDSDDVTDWTVEPADGSATPEEVTVQQLEVLELHERLLADCAKLGFGPGDYKWDCVTAESGTLMDVARKHNHSDEAVRQMRRRERSKLHGMGWSSESHRPDRDPAENDQPGGEVA